MLSQEGLAKSPLFGGGEEKASQEILPTLRPKFPNHFQALLWKGTLQQKKPPKLSKTAAGLSQSESRPDSRRNCRATRHVESLTSTPCLRGMPGTHKGDQSCCTGNRSIGWIRDGLC